MVNSLRSLRGIHNTNEKFKKVAKKGSSVDRGLAKEKSPEPSVKIIEDDCASKLSHQNKKRKVLDGAERASGMAGRSFGAGGPILQRSHVLGGDYSHAINDLRRPDTWDDMEKADYKSVVASVMNK